MIVCRGLFGIRALVPGWGQFEVRPQPGDLQWANVRAPSRVGPIDVAFNQSAGYFSLLLQVPAAAVATACVPRLGLRSDSVKLNGVATHGQPDGDFLCVGGIGPRSGGTRITRDATGPRVE